MCARARACVCACKKLISHVVKNPITHVGARWIMETARHALTAFNVALRMDESFCLTSTVARWPIRDGDEGGRGGKKSKTSSQAPPRKTKASVDRRHNNKMLSALRSDYCTTQSLSQLLRGTESKKDNVRSSAVGKQLKQKKSNSQALLG